MDKLNQELYNQYVDAHKNNAVNAILADYRNMFNEEPPFMKVWNSGDISSNYTFEEEIEIYITAIREKRPYKLKDGDILYEDNF